MADTADQIRRAEMDLNTQFTKLGRMGSSDPLGMRNGVEAKYSQAYQRLVRLGARPQLRKKYRGQS